MKTDTTPPAMTPPRPEPIRAMEADQPALPPLPEGARKPCRTHEENAEMVIREDLSVKEMTEAIHDMLMSKGNAQPPTPDQIFNYSPSGELSEVFAAFWGARCYFTGETIAVNCKTGEITFTPPVALLNAQEPAPVDAGDNWRGIETAPKDGSVVDIWVRKERIADAYFRKGFWTCWGLDQFGSSGHVRVEGDPTHWQPLPQPPAERRGE